MHAFKKKVDMEKACSSPSMYSKNTKLSVNLEVGHKSHTFGNMDMDSNCSENPKEAMSNLQRTQPTSTKEMRMTKFENDFLSTMHGLYKDAGLDVLPFSVEKFEKVSEKVQKDAAVFFENYARENILQDDLDEDTLDATEDAFVQWDEQGVSYGLQVDQESGNNSKIMDKTENPSDGASLKLSDLSHSTSNSNGRRNSSVSGRRNSSVKGRGKSCFLSLRRANLLFFKLCHSNVCYE
jgi:hypothetical protein